MADKDAIPGDSRVTGLPDRVRSLAALFAIAGVLVMVVGALRGSFRNAPIADLFVLLESIAVLLGGIYLLLLGTRAASPTSGRPHQSNRQKQGFGVLAVILLVALPIQNWFVTGTVVAGWDQVPPQGTAWIGRLFAAWAPSGTNLGGPSAQETQLPWAVVLWLVHQTGFSAGLAQRVWYTALFVGTGLAAYLLLRVISCGVPASITGALLYVFNPYSLVSDVSPVYIAAMMLLPLLVALILIGSRGARRLLLSVAAMAACAPLVGYAYQNPPLVGMLALACIVAVPLAWMLHGRASARNAMTTAVLGGGLLMLCSLYWLIPSELQLASFAQSLYTPLSSWIWEESRATLANALWLNTNWGWHNRQFFPYSTAYSGGLVAICRFVLPAFAFVAVALVFSCSGTRNFVRQKITVASAAVALAVVVISTGTNPPGSVLFDLFYRLPYGWLLREPFRFLMVCSLSYAILAAIAVDMVTSFATTALGMVRTIVRRLAARLALWLAIVTAVVLALVPAYPMITGAVIPTPERTSARSSILAPHHVTVPGYWSSMATFLNEKTAPSGSVVALPVDGVSDMVHYQWGYTGVDAFMVDLIKRQIIAPNNSSYFGNNTSLMNLVDDLQTAILHHDWGLTSDIAGALASPLMLVRTDIRVTDAGYTLAHPDTLVAALLRNPRATLVRRIGPLFLFRLNTANTNNAYTGGRYATVNSRQPNPTDLALLPGGYALVSGPQVAGRVAIQEVPSFSGWHLRDGSLYTNVFEPNGWTYQTKWVTSGGQQVPVNYVAERTKPAVGGSEETLSLTVSPQPNLVPDGSFVSGPWQPAAGDCNDGGVPQAFSVTGIKGAVTGGGPNGSPMLQLSAGKDSACESMKLHWSSGPMLVSLWAKSIAGGTPQFCILEQPTEKCKMLVLSNARQWHRYQFVVDPQAGTTALTMFLYADATSRPTSEGYSQIRVVQLPTTAHAVIVGTPNGSTARASELTTLTNAFSGSWQAPSGYDHVLVDGVRNGWLGGGQLSTRSIHYRDGSINIGFLLSAVGGMLLVVMLMGATNFGRRFRRSRLKDARLDRGERRNVP